MKFELYEYWAWDMAHVDTTMGGFYIVYFELQSITKDMYYYLKSISDSNESGMGLFTEPVQVYSNISMGWYFWGFLFVNDITFSMGAILLTEQSITME